MPYSMSSGCAATARQRSQFSGSAGSRSAMAATVAVMDPARLHPQARTALSVQRRAPLTVATIDEARRSMVDATPDEIGPGPALPTVVDLPAESPPAGVPARLYRDGAP